MQLPLFKATKDGDLLLAAQYPKQSLASIISKLPHKIEQWPVDTITRMFVAISRPQRFPAHLSLGVGSGEKGAWFWKCPVFGSTFRHLTGNGIELSTFITFAA